MPRSKATSAITRHLWNDHGRVRAEGTQTQRELIHEELHATTPAEDIGHTHNEDGSYDVVCPCGHSHTCTVLSPSED